MVDNTTSAASSGPIIGSTDLFNNIGTGGANATQYTTYNGFDLVWSQQQLQAQMKTVEAQMQQIESNDNLSDTEKMFTMQMTMNSWSAISNLRTNMLKSVSDTLKSVARNIN